MLLLCLALANVGWSTPAWAVSADELLDLMVDEGAITPEKAQKIKDKARKIDQVKKAEEDAKRARELQQVKQEAKEEAKVEAKAEASKEAQAVVTKNNTDLGLGGISKALKGLNVGVLAYIDYSAGDRPTFRGPLTTSTGKPPANSGNFGRNVDGHVGSDQWTLTRGYLTVTKEITPWLAARSTTDIFQDAANTSWLVREKYLYAELRPPNLGNFLTQNKSEVGLGHTPWHDFEETVYPYRCQGTIPIERAGVFSSADIGVSIRGNFGGQLANAEEKTGNAGYDGRYGSWHLGVYNGCGYSAAEVNQNKVPEYRVTIRPLPDYLPGLQATYFGLYGKGNSSTRTQFNTAFPGPAWVQYYPDWVVNQGYLSYQHPWFILTAQVFASKGNQAGNWITQPNGPKPIGIRADSLWTMGYSVFGDVKVPLQLWSGSDKYPLHVFYRTDWFNADQNHEIAESAKYTKMITGIAYHLYKNNMILLDYEKTWYGQDYAANFGPPGTIGAGGGLAWPSSLTARTVASTSNGGNLGTDQRFQVVFQISY
ncbi:MAG: cell envelope integrity protein TolA [Desulfobaccales bacterium]